MKTYAEALATVLESIEPLGTERVALRSAAGRVLAEDVLAPLDLPPFDNSSVDGYGVRAADLASGSPLRVRREIPAGNAAGDPISVGEAVRIFTGSPIPLGVDAVVMQEDVRREGDEIRIGIAVTQGDFIRRRGAELARGTVAIDAHTLISPPVIGLLGMLGLTEVNVMRRPTIALVGTGSELVPPGTPLAEGQIYDANTEALAQAIETLGFEIGGRRSWTSDDYATTRRVLDSALDADIVLTSGGVSVGDHDHVRRALTELEVTERVWRVAMRPGKPFYFGVAPSGARVFGLPGNPVSALVTFYVLVRPALAKMVGLPPVPWRTVPLASPVAKRGDRADFVRAREVDGRALVASAQESHMLSGLASADLLLYLPQNSGPYDEGDIVEALPLRWSSFT